MIAAIMTAILTSTQQVNPGMETPWTKSAITAEVPWQEYPRPQMARDNWTNLNGKWEFAIASKEETAWPGKQSDILVPFPPQSMISGVTKFVSSDQAVWYRREFDRPEFAKAGQDILLHFEAIDYEATVWVNGKEVARHKGGYDPFTIVLKDIQDQDNEILVRAWDGANETDQPGGKQVFQPNGIWYTNISGIWQTVWLEPVPQDRISDIHFATDMHGNVNALIDSTLPGAEFELKVFDEGNLVAESRNLLSKEGQMSLKIKKPKLWSPESPHLYDVEIRMFVNGDQVDMVTSYFGLRTLEKRRDQWGERFYLNAEPIFMFGPLDQGWWPDGLYTPPSDDAMRYDLEFTKQAGFNTVRKHVKIENSRWYRHCDELGLLVWQDMPNGHKYFPGWNTDHTQWNAKADASRPAASISQFRQELTNMVDRLSFFPCIAAWVPFNEAWSQFQTKETVALLKELDPTRLVNPASGGNFVHTGDIFDIHVYPGPGISDPKEGMILVLGEYGGLGLPVEGHLWQKQDNWGYRTFDSAEALEDKYADLVQSLYLLKGKGLSAAIYTQTTDVEIEVNGLLTYDRKVSKIASDRLAKINSLVYEPPLKLTPILPSADEKPQVWEYTFEKPGDDWYAKDTQWKTGKGGFGTQGTPNAVIGTVWNGSNVWIKAEFQMSSAKGTFWLKIHHDEDATVYLNGKEVCRLEEYSKDYTYVKLPTDVLQTGLNRIAISCQQSTGGQYIDAGIYQQVDP